MHFHWQNLNERRTGADGMTPTGFPWTGRAWLYFGRLETTFEWALGGLHTGFHIQHDDEGVNFMFGVPLICLFLKLQSTRLARDHRLGERELALKIYDWAIHWNVWTPMHFWSSQTPKHRCGSFLIDDFLLGERKYSSRTLGWRWVEVPMPERIYYGVAQLEESTWKRARGFAKRIIRCHIEMLPGEQIPVPGKGENSWDCGEDATLGHTAPAQTIDDGIADVVRSCLKQRSKYGGREWRPSPKKGSNMKAAT